MLFLVRVCTNFCFQVWPESKVIFPDFFKTSVHDLWKRLIVKHHKQISFDALWIVSLIILTRLMVKLTQGAFLSSHILNPAFQAGLLRKKKKPGPSCSKLTTSLVNVSLKFQT